MIAMLKNYAVRVADFTTAFLHADVGGEVIFVRPPRILRKPHTVWRVHKAWYGLRKAPQLFMQFLARVLLSLDLRRSRADPMLFYNQEQELYMSTHVDDPIVVGPLERISWLFDQLSQRMKFKPGAVFGTDVVKYLGKHYRRDEEGIKVQQPVEYIDAMLDRFGLKQSRPAITPTTNAMQPSTPQEKATWTDVVEPELHHLFRMLVGQLSFLLTERSDLLFVTKELSREMSAPTGQSIARLKRALRYIAGTRDPWLCLRVDPEEVPRPGEPIAIKVWTDSDFAGDIITRKSTTCVVVKACGVLIHQNSATQSVLATISGEAEFYAIGSGAAIGLGIRTILEELGFTSQIQVYSDSSAARAMANRLGLGRTRHIAVKYLWIQDLIAAGLIKLIRIESKLNLAGVGTKGLNALRLRMLCEMIGLQFSEAQSAVEQVYSKDLILFEWCCDSNSLLTAEWQRRGFTAYRLGLPLFDLSDASTVRRTVGIMLLILKSGQKVWIWFSLPCTPWSSWQRVNTVEFPQSVDRLEAARNHSRCMLSYVLYVLKHLHTYVENGQLHVGFEWPRFSDGWQLQELEELGRTATLTAEFDGCAYNLKAKTGQLLKKPWRVQTTSPIVAQSLVKKCSGTHDHAECRGQDATQSGLYSRTLVQALVKAMTKSF